MSNTLQFLWFGIVQGSIIAAGAVGFTLIFGVMNFFNVAYAEYMIVAPYVALSTLDVVPHPIVAVFIGLIAAGIVALATDRVVYRQFRDRNPFTLMIVAIGLSFIIRSMVRIIWGSSAQIIQFTIPGSVRLGGVLVLYESVLLVVVALLILAGVFVVLSRTRIGIAMRASSENKDLIRVRGVNPERVVIAVTIMAGLIAGIAGILIGMDSEVSPLIGFITLIPIIAATIIGGVGDPRGAVVAGFGIGILQELSVLVLTPNYKPAIALLIVIVGIALKPEGLFGSSTRV